MKNEPRAAGNIGTESGAPQPPSEQPPSSEIVRKILEAVATVRYGSVEIVIQNARVVQIERKEKFRFDKS